MADLTETSRYISLILRHKPETIGITLARNRKEIRRIY